MESDDESDADTGSDDDGRGPIPVWARRDVAQLADFPEAVLTVVPECIIQVSV